MAFSTASHFWMMITMLTLLTLVSSLSGGIRYRENFLEEVLGDLEDIRESVDYNDAMEDMHLSESDVNVYDLEREVDYEPPIEVDKGEEIDIPHPTAKTQEPDVTHSEPPAPDFAKPPVANTPETPIQMPPSACAANAHRGQVHQPMSQVSAWEPDAFEYASV